MGFHLLFLAMAAACAVAAQAKLDDVAFAIEATCGQIGAAPANLTSDLPTGRGETGYDYTCYQPQQSVQRWSTTFGWPKGLMVLVDDTGGCYCDSDFTFNTDMVQPYFMRNEAAMVVGPFLVFGILATIFLTCWSCGMMKCCCCQCCNKPPAFTKGMAGVILTFITVALGGAAAILAIRGIASSTQQDVALTALKESFADFALWPNTTVTQVDENYDELRATMQSGRALEATFAQLTVEEVQIPAFALTAGLAAHLTDAQTYMGYARAQMADLYDNLGKKSADMTEIFDESVIGGLRKTILFLLWLVLVGLMGFQIVIALLRRLAPKKTAGCLCNCSFSAMTAISLVVMFIMFLAASGIGLVLMPLADLCADPDNIIRNTMEADTCQVRLHSDGVTNLYNDNCDFTLKLSGALTGVEKLNVTKVYEVDVAAALANTKIEVIPFDANDLTTNLNRDPNLLGYFLTCDTKAGATNPFNFELERMMDEISAAQTMLGADLFATFEATAEYTALAADATALSNYNADKKLVVDAIAPVVDGLRDLSEALSGERDAAAIEWNANEGQGLTKGLLSKFSCYQGNSRYNAMISLLCTSTFDTLVQTYEYFMAAAVLMIIIQWTKRWSRPTMDDDGEGEEGGGGGGDDVAEKGVSTFGGDPVVNSLMSL